MRLALPLVLGLALLAPVRRAAAAPEPVGPEMLLTTDSSRALLDAARRDLLDLRLDAAEATLLRLQNRPDGAPAALAHRATAALLRGFLTDEDRHFVVFVRRADSLKGALGRQPATRWRAYLEAESELQRAIVHGRGERLTRAALAARSAYNAYERALQGGAFPDADKGFGMLQLLIGSAPGTYRWMLRLLGFGGTVEGGRARIVRAMETSRYNREEARLYLAVLDAVVRGDHPGALATVAPLATERPSSPLVGHVYGFCLLSDRRATDAARALQAVVDAERTPGVVPVRYALYFLGDAYFKLGRYPEAERYLRRYVQEHRGPSLRSAAFRTLGLVLELQGRRAEALGPYRQVRHTRISETEEVAVRLTRRLLAAPLAPAERALIEAHNLFENRQEAAAEALLRPLLADSALAPAYRPRAHVQLGRVLMATDRGAEARAHFRAAYEAPGPDPLDGWGPWGHFHAGETLAAEGKRAEARAHFEAALGYEGAFDYHLTLEQNAKTALEKVR